jgi:quinoprotein glucose dehydrogenase
MVAILPARTQQAASGEWRSYGGGKNFQRYAPIDRIRAENVGGLRIVWIRPGLDAQFKNAFPDAAPGSTLRATPIMVGGTLYAQNGLGLVEAFDAVTGQTKWLQRPMPTSPRDAAGQAARGVEYWRSGADERILFIRGEYLWSLDAQTGEPIAGFGTNGKVFLNRNTFDRAPYRATSGPIVVNDVVIVGGGGGGRTGAGFGDGGTETRALPEDPRAYDVRTGRLLWTFRIIPEAGKPGAETWGNGSGEVVGNMAVWGPITADETLGYVYLATTAPTNSYYGGHRPGENRHADSLVAVDAKSGNMVWAFQTVHHDVWDYDTAAPPILGDVRVNGSVIKAVMQASKTGFLYVLDRVTGKPVWPIEERPVPPSTVPGEVLSPTQPFPTKPPAFDRQGVTEDDLIDFTPELRQEALEIAKQFILGPMFAPPSLVSDEPGGTKGTLIAPGVWGSGNWNTGAFDPETGMYYAVSQTEANVYGLIKTDRKATLAFTLGVLKTPVTGRPERLGPVSVLPYAPTLKSGLPILKPPYGRITALDLTTGEMAWQVPNGEGPRNHELLKHLNLPRLGTAGRPAPLLTKTLLFVGELGPGPWKFHAYDKKTGQLLTEVELSGPTTGAPMTYEVGDRQFVVVPVGGRNGIAWVALGLEPVPGAVMTHLAPEPDPMAPVVFSASQAQRGETTYRQKCQACHLQSLIGGVGFATPLVGDRFWTTWSGRSARSLYSRIITTMPPDDAGTLAEKDVIDVVAYILRRNGLSPAATTVTTARELNPMKLERAQ